MDDYVRWLSACGVIPLVLLNKGTRKLRVTGKTIVEKPAAGESS